MRLTYRQFNHIGLKRLNNEDAAGIVEIDKGLLSVVCDGLGGSKAGDIASKTAVESIIDSFSSSDTNDYIEKIRSAVMHANKTIFDRAINNSLLSGMATTVEVLFLKDYTAYWAHIGDSRIYILKNRKLKPLTKDHSLVQRLVDEGYLTLKEAENHPNKNIIMRALGDNLNVEIDLSKMKISPEDENLFFICSDGITTVMNNAEIEMILSSNPDNLQAIENEIAAVVTQRGAPDNYTFILIKVE